MSEGATAVIGPADSSATLASVEVANRQEVPMITPVGANPQITESGSEWVFRTSASDVKQARAVGEALGDVDVSTVSILHIADAYGQGGEQVLSEVLEDQGIGVAATVPYPKDSQDFTAEVARAVEGNPGAIVIWGTQADSASIMSELDSRGYGGEVFGSGGLGAPFFVNLAGPLANGIAFPTTFVASTSDLAAEFAEDYEATFGSLPDQFAAQGYTAIQAIAEAVLEAGSADSVDVQRALGTISFTSPLGEFSFDETGDSVVDVQLARWSDGVPVPYDPSSN